MDTNLNGRLGEPSHATEPVASGEIAADWRAAYKKWIDGGQQRPYRAWDDHLKPSTKIAFDQMDLDGAMLRNLNLSRRTMTAVGIPVTSQTSGWYGSSLQLLVLLGLLSFLPGWYDVECSTEDVYLTNEEGTQVLTNDDGSKSLTTGRKVRQCAI